MNDNTMKIISLSDGKRSSLEISSILGLTPRYVRKVMKKKGLPQLHRGAQVGARNHRYVSGRRIDLDGYALVTAPLDHPYARQRTNRMGKVIFEHRLVLEKKLGRYLLPTETVDHIDGLTLHNAPDNLRIFPNNGAHLQTTTTGMKHYVSKSGKKNISLKHLLPEDFQPVDIYWKRRECGDVRLRQMIRAALKLGIDSPFLSGTHRHFEKAGIWPLTDSTIRHAWDDLSKRWEEYLLL